MKLLILLCLTMAGCTTIEDRTFLYSPLTQEGIINSKPKLTNLGSLDASGAGGKCVTCAH